MSELLNLKDAYILEEGEISKIISLSGILEQKIWNIYVYGSRIYGTFRENSDYDVKIVASTLDANKEIKDKKYNIHICTPDIFYDNLAQYKMVDLECIFAPSHAKLRERKNFNKDFSLDINKMKKFVFSQSRNSWTNGKIKLLERDILRGSKSIFHSMRILLFGIQIAKTGGIFDFSDGSHILEQINEDNFLKWNDLKNKWLPFKRDIEYKLMDQKEE